MVGIKTDAKVILTFSPNINDPLINCQTETIKQIEGIVRKVYVKLMKKLAQKQ